MTLPFLVVLLAILYFVLKLSGILDEWADASQRPRRPRREAPPWRGSRLERRLDLFRDFIDRLPPGDEDEQRE